MSLSSDPRREQGVLDALPGLARLTAGVWVRGVTWGLRSSVRIGGRLTRAAVNPAEAGELVAELTTAARNRARGFLGVGELEALVSQILGPVDGRGPSRQNGPGPSLRVLGAQLLRESADVNVDDRSHPAYARILQELAPDEARILRLLALEGPQPSVDVRATNLIGVGSQLVAPGLNMIGPASGVRHIERVPAYLNNLERLGLIWFSREPLDDPVRYQVLEAQPQVLEAIKDSSRAKTIQRSIHLTPFGRDFCDTCLPLDTEEIEALSDL